MFCPNCGQQQAAEAARFCPRCGFPQNGVTALLQAQGQWPGMVEPPPASPRKRGVRQGALMFFLGIVLTPLLGVITETEQVAGVTALIFILGGLLRMLYAAIFEDGQNPVVTLPAAPAVAPYTPPGQPLFAQPPANALPPQQTPLATHQWRPPHSTQEIINPPNSVTEHTTRMLKRETDS
jgi:hypothetical protein